ncbi:MULTISPECIES: hypothetical protein [Butyricicoccus]|nr:hypothetical protein [Butyricicoccus porcorum]MDD6987253.1 hypothetical protein [Butyricicoccus porcorum]MDY4483879.1 hypothetical protein [Butyricicoccus porcorum]
MPLGSDGKTENILPILIGMVEMHTGLVYIMDGQDKTGGFEAA